MKTNKIGLTAAAVALASAGFCFTPLASATVITFSGLPGTTGDPFSTYTEGGFTVEAQFGNWKEAHAFGNPIPSLFVSDFSSTPFGSLKVTAGGSLFTFNSADLSAGLSGIGYEIAGWVGSTQVFSIAANHAVSAGFFTVPASNASAQIDRLTIDISSGGPGEFNVDNINVAAIPEPETYALLLAGAVPLLVAARRRARSA